MDSNPTDLINRLLREIQPRILEEQKRDQSVWLSSRERSIFIKINTGKFLGICRLMLGNDAVFESIKERLKLLITRSLGTRSRKDFDFDAEKLQKSQRNSVPQPTWLRIQRTFNEEKIYFLVKTKQRILEDAEYMIERVINKIRLLTVNETDPHRILAIKEIEISDFLSSFGLWFKEYPYAADVLPEIKASISQQIYTALTHQPDFIILDKVKIPFVSPNEINIREIDHYNVEPSLQAFAEPGGAVFSFIDKNGRTCLTRHQLNHNNA